MDMRATPKLVAGTSAALGKKHDELALLIVSVVKGNLTTFNSFFVLTKGAQIPAMHCQLDTRILSECFHLPLIPFDSFLAF